MASAPNEKAIQPFSWVQFFSQWGPLGASFGLILWIVAHQYPEERRGNQVTIQRIIDVADARLEKVRNYDQEMRNLQWKHDADIHAKLIQTMDVQNKASLEQVYELRRVRESLDKIGKP